MSRSEHRWAWLWAVVFVGLTCLPYLVAWQLAPVETQYTGLLINHYDGASYYAKMQQGVRGDWLFHLAFTPEPHDGAFIFSFYLALGHLAAALGMPIPLTYHLARAAAGLFFLLVAYRFIARCFDRIQTRRTAFLLLGSSAGFGWLLAPLGLTTADLWVVEGFTFLSILANPHFPLAMGVMLLTALSVFDLRDGAPGVWRLAGSAGLGLLLAVIQPFAVPVVLAILAVYLGLLALRDRRLPTRRGLVAGAAGLGAAPVMAYDLYVYRTNPALAAWSAQNLTPSLPPWDYTLAYGLVLLMAIGGIAIALRRRGPADLLLLSWVGSAAVLMYVPFALQRRFITGLHIPLAILGALGLEQIVWPRIRFRRRAWVTGLILGFSALTSLFVPLIAVAGVAQGRRPLVMSREEATAYAWLQEHSSWTDTVLAPPEAGQFVPAWAGNRVVYGHPFETIDAETKEAEAAEFFGPAPTLTQQRALLERYDVRYVLSLSADEISIPAALGLSPIWAEDSVALYHRVAGR